MCRLSSLRRRRFSSAECRVLLGSCRWRCEAPPPPMCKIARFNELGGIPPKFVQTNELYVKSSAVRSCMTRLGTKVGREEDSERLGRRSDRRFSWTGTDMKPPKNGLFAIRRSRRANRYTLSVCRQQGRTVFKGAGLLRVEEWQRWGGGVKLRKDRAKGSSLYFGNHGELIAGDKGVG